VIPATISVVAGPEKNAPGDHEEVVNQREGGELSESRRRAHRASPLRIFEFTLRTPKLLKTLKFLKSLKVESIPFTAQLPILYPKR